MENRIQKQDGVVVCSEKGEIDGDEITSIAGSTVFWMDGWMYVCMDNGIMDETGD